MVTAGLQRKNKQKKQKDWMLGCFMVDTSANNVLFVYFVFVRQ